MEPDDLARPSRIANLGDDLLTVHMGNSRSTPGKKFHAVLMGGGYMCMLPYDVDYFELKQDRKSAGSGWSLVLVTAFQWRGSRSHESRQNDWTSSPDRHTEIWL